MKDTGPGGQRDDAGMPDVGSLAEEAAKLFGALSTWARDHAAEVGEGVTGLAEHAAAAANDVNEHLATGARECTYCPICRTVHAVRGLSPEVRSHLTAAAASIAQAVAVLMATPEPPSRGDDPGVERIDVGDDWSG